ncbi:MAG TPA: GWxTD domain-containing protein, partial [Gemmatimonadaceae bacterium]|nr:GWxTD domain-containing protein [Gemmatimonadaceae bacterium]
WRRYDALAYRRHPTQPGADIRSIVETLVPPCVYYTPPLPACPKRPMKYIREAITTQTVPMPGEGGDIERAEALFREAYDAAPTNPRAVRHVAMIFAERSDWRGLEQFAKRHLAQTPWDAWGWLSLGLASHRLGNVGAASAAFDSAMALLAGSERSRLDRLDRVLSPQDTSKAVRGTDAERAAYQRLYWAMADPVWSRNGNSSKTEYLARVTFAELRWTVDELHVRGADTDRGDVFIRYGPPEIVASFAPGVSATSDGADGGAIGNSSSVSTVWVYGTDLAFVFVGQPTFATARTPPADVHLADQLMQAQPVRFDNVPRPTVDSLLTQLARFRGGRDSVDVFVAANIPASAIRASQTVAGIVQGDVWFMTGNATITYHDSTNLTADGMHTWQHRVAPGGYLYRVQAAADAATRAARSTGVIDAASVTADPFAIHGTAISDVLLASSATAPPAGSRWNAVKVDPIVGGVAHGGSLSLVWENYEFGARGTSAEYTIAVSLVQQKGTLGRISAAVLGGLASAARINRGDDRMTISFDRTVAHSAAFADMVTIGLNDTPSGNYLLTLQITDRVTGKVMTRTRPLIIRE